MKKQTIIFDIDGTAIDSPKQELPTPRLVKAIRNLENDYYLCAATGRVWSFAKPVLHAMRLSDPCIISGGTQICDPETGKILWQTNLLEGDLEKAVAIFKMYSKYKVLYNDSTREDYLYGGIPPNELGIKEPVYFIEQIFVPEKITPEIVKKLSQIDGVACTVVVAQRSGFNDIHVTNRSATKEHAVAELLKTIKVNRSQTIGVGDGYNDIHLFSAVNKKIAVGNAVDELKSTANLVVGDVKNDGFAEYLESLAGK